MTKEKAVKEYLMNELYCPYQKDSKFVVDLGLPFDGKVNYIYITTDKWEIDLFLSSKDIHLNTLDNNWVDEYDIYYVFSIYSSCDELYKLVNGDDL